MDATIKGTVLTVGEVEEIGQNKIPKRTFSVQLDGSESVLACDLWRDNADLHPHENDRIEVKISIQSRYSNKRWFTGCSVIEFNHISEGG